MGAELEKELGYLKNLAFRYLAIRPRSRAEMAAYLAKKGADDAALSRVMEALEGFGYIDDRKFAEMYARHLAGRKSLSRGALFFELSRKGVSAEDAEAAVGALCEAGELEDDFTAALRAAEKRLASMRGVEREKTRRRLADFLRRRGYGYEVMGKVLKEIL